MPETSGLSAQPNTVVVERVLAATPAQVFQAWGDPERRRVWDVPDDGWIVTDHRQDFRVGGSESRRFGPPHAPDFSTEGSYLHIRTDQLIISSGVMRHQGIVTTATMCTVHITPHPDGVVLRVIDQSVYLGSETSAQREGGWAQALHRLAAHLGDTAMRRSEE